MLQEAKLMIAFQLRLVHKRPGVIKRVLLKFKKNLHVLAVKYIELQHTYTHTTTNLDIFLLSEFEVIFTLYHVLSISSHFRSRQLTPDISFWCWKLIHLIKCKIIKKKKMNCLKLNSILSDLHFSIFFFFNIFLFGKWENMDRNWLHFRFN